MATRLFESVLRNSREVLQSEMKFTESELDRSEQLVRLAALLHDVGHSPFSHASEDLFPFRDEKPGKRYVHEEYSSSIILHELAEVIEGANENCNLGIKAREVANLIEGSSNAGKDLFWKDLISGQMDADRMDYLQRDSYHLGVQYGRFDFNRVASCLVAVPGDSERSPRIGIEEGGWRAAESLILARYSMFTQVYFHKTRIAYDCHLAGAMKNILPSGVFPKPSPGEVKDFLKWDDWRVQGALADGQGGEHAGRLLERRHYRRVFGNPEVSTNADVLLYSKVSTALGALVAHVANPEKSWYKVGKSDVPVLLENGSILDSRPLSQISRIVKAIEEPQGEILIYVRPEDVKNATEIIKEVKQNANH